MKIKNGIISLMSVLCIFSFAACSSAPVAGNQPVAGQTATVQSSPTVTANANGTPKTTQTMPATTTDCPASGTARPAVMSSLALGSDPAIVYAVNSPDGTTSPIAILKRYDTKTEQKTSILTLQNTSIQSEQLSADGQWVLFVAKTIGSSDRLEMVRLDGQGQQTLYCDSSLAFVQWSPDQKYIAFEPVTASIDLLTLANGTLQTELQNDALSGTVHVQTWFDNTHIYLFGLSDDGHRDGIFLLDITRGANQNIQNIPQLSQSQFLDFDSSSDGQHLYIAGSDCETMGCVPPGSITVQSATSASAGQVLLNDPKHVILDIRAVVPDILFFIINNGGNPSLDQTQNGLWEMRSDGTGLTQLTNNTSYANTDLNGYSQYSWSNLSRDSTLFAVEEDTQGGTDVMEKSSLVFAGLYSSYSLTFAQGDATQVLDIVGWTTM